MGRGSRPCHIVLFGPQWAESVMRVGHWKRCLKTGWAADSQLSLITCARFFHRLHLLNQRITIKALEADLPTAVTAIQ